MDQNGFFTVRGYQLLGQETKITSAMEDYLEMICRNRDRCGALHMNLLAELLHVKASSATKMVQKLGALGLLQYEKYGDIVLTPRGCEFGSYLLYRHKTMEDFLRLIGAENILQQTELIEHNVSEQTLGGIGVLNAFFSAHPSVASEFESYRQAAQR